MVRTETKKPERCCFASIRRREFATQLGFRITTDFAQAQDKSQKQFVGLNLIHTNTKLQTPRLEAPMSATNKLAVRHFMWSFALNAHTYVFLCDACTPEELYENFVVFVGRFSLYETDEIVEEIFARFDTISNFVGAWWMSEDSAERDLLIAMSRHWLELFGLVELC